MKAFPCQTATPPTALCLPGSHKSPQCSDVTCTKAPTSLLIKECAPASLFFRRLSTLHGEPQAAARPPWPQPAPHRDTAPGTPTQVLHDVYNRGDVVEWTMPHVGAVHGITPLLWSCCKHLRWGTNSSTCSKPQMPQTSSLSSLQPYLVLSCEWCSLTQCPQEIICCAESFTGTVCPALCRECAFTWEDTGREQQGVLGLSEGHCQPRHKAGHSQWSARACRGALGGRGGNRSSWQHRASVSTVLCGSRNLLRDTETGHPSMLALSPKEGTGFPPSVKQARACNPQQRKALERS